MLDEELKELLKLCLVIIERDFAPCGLKHDAKKRIIKLYEQWKKAKVEAEKERRTIGGYKLIFSDLLRAVNLAQELAKRYKKSKCHYLKKWLMLPPNTRGGLGVWSKSMQH